MKKVTIFWKGQSKSEKFYIGVSFEEAGFVCKKFLNVTEDKYAELPETGEISVPNAALA